jgi:PAS domain S-box-containing protein
MRLKKLLGEIMTSMGFVTRQQLNEALLRQGKILKEETLPERLQRAQLVSEARPATDKIPLLGKILTDMGFATEEQLEEALKEQEKMAETYKSLESEKLATAMEIGFIVNSTLNLAEVLTLTMRHVNSVTNSLASTLMLLDDKTGELVFSVPTGPKEGKLTDIRLPWGKGIAGWVAEHEEPVLVPSAREDPRFYAEIDTISGFGTKSILCVPLKAKAKLIGVLEVMNKADGTPFTEQDGLLLSVFASLAAMAIENAKLCGELKDRLEGEIQVQKRDAENITEKVRVKEELSKQYRDHLEELVAERTAELTRASEQLKKEIGERGHTEQELRESEHQYRMLVETMNDGLAMVDNNMVLSFVNDKFCEILGYTRQELIGRPGTDLHNEANQRVFKEQMARQRRGEHEPYEIEFTRKDGQQRYAIVSPRPTFDAEGHFQGSFAAVTDITEHKRAGEALRNYRDKLEKLIEERTAELTRANEQLKKEIGEHKRAEEALRNYRDHLEELVEMRTKELEGVVTELESFAYSVSHDLGAPLKAMQGFTQALLEEYAPKLDGQGREYARRIAASSERMDALIRDLLDYSRLSRSEVEFENVDLKSVLETVLRQLDSEIEASGAKVTVMEPLPEVLSHASTLEQVVGNLISNAIKFVPTGVKPEVLVWAEQPGHVVKLWVEDNGIGISPEHQERIFHIFERLHGIKAYPGTGIGLAMVRRGMEKLGGKAGVESTPGKGSKFWIELGTVKGG